MNVLAEIDSIDSIRELVLRGKHATVMPVSVFSSDAASRRAVTMSGVAGIPLNRFLMLASRIEGRQPMAIEIVKEIVRVEFEALSRRGVFSIPPRAPDRRRNRGSKRRDLPGASALAIAH